MMDVQTTDVLQDRLVSTGQAAVKLIKDNQVLADSELPDYPGSDTQVNIDTKTQPTGA